MKYLVKILKVSENFYEDAYKVSNTEHCSLSKNKENQYEFSSNDLYQFCLFCQSDFFKENVFEIEKSVSNFSRFAVTSVWKNGIEMIMFTSIVEAIDFDHSKGIHQRMVQEANVEKLKNFSLTMCSSVNNHHLTELKELKL